jgi:hypothetical protein
MYIGSDRGKGLGSRVRSSQPEHSMTRADEFWNDCGTNEACGPSDKDSHVLFSS